ncbi:MAG: ACT domain-containing protein [Chloroflexota bacterium]|nr:ACT domain-containing protein [Chloroflexota bacterium]
MSGPLLGFAGEHGSFAEDAAVAYAPGCRTLPLASFTDVFAAVRDGRADGGVVPIENVRQGSVREVYDLLLDHPLTIVGEAVVRVRLCLAALPGQSLDDIERVYSHVQALAQAEPFLRSRPWTLFASTNTAGAGVEIVRRRENGAAAVLSPRAAELHGLTVLAADIAADPRNRSRFLVLARSAPEWAVPAAGDAMRTTIAFAVVNEPGSLLRVLAVLVDHGINMSKLESRPSRELAWEYVFWADLDADLCAHAAAGVVERLRGVSAWLRILGCYPVGGSAADV